MWSPEDAAILMGGRSGPMDTSDFIELVNRNKRAEGVSWRRERFDDCLSHLVTCTVGDPLEGNARNVSTPSIPEFTDFLDKKTRVGIFCRGWRHLLLLFVTDGWIYPSQEVRKWLGDSMWDTARWAGPCH
ncbi:MAG: hypothetical protein DRQ56_08920 [Gammaproteobacteria bacterium]|nr:MAG: hypothetical protein DRQ56_08920 [Gammaproteobacteria bacterium]